MTEATPMAAGPTMKRPGSAMTRMRRGSLASAARIGAQKRTMSAAGWHVVDRKSAADVERVERAEPLAPRRGEQPGAGLDRLDVLVRVRRLRADVKGQSAHRRCQAPPPPARARARPPGRSRTCATDRTPRPGFETTRAAAARLDRRARELAHLVRIVGDEGAHAEVKRVADVALAT